MIRILFQTESHYPVDRKKIKAAVVRELEARVHRDTEVSISIVGDRRMRMLNKKYRSLDRTTTVLSFPQNDPAQKEQYPFFGPPDDVLRIGDIVVSYPQAVKEARDRSKLVDEIILEFIFHGLEHLMGIHHQE